MVKRNLGYSLVELLVVISILGFLSAMALYGIRSSNNTQPVVNAQKEFLSRFRSAQTRVNNGAKGASDIYVFVPRVGSSLGNSYFVKWEPAPVTATTYLLPTGVTVSSSVTNRDIFVCVANPNVSQRPCKAECSTDDGDAKTENGFYCNGDDSFSAPLRIYFRKGNFTKCLDIEGSGYRITRIYEPETCS